MRLPYLFGIFAAGLLSIHASATDTIDLSGEWSLCLATQAVASIQPVAGPFNDTVHLPGTLSQADKGNPLDLQPKLPPLPPEHFLPQKNILFGRSTNYAVENISLMHLHQRFSYVGPAWYRREVEIPKDWTNQDVELVLERVIWQSRVWVNGEYLGAHNSLTTPHRYEIGGALKAGRNEILICIDNRRQLAIGDPHAYTEESQTIWNGVIGRIALVARDKIRIEGIELRPDLARHGVEVTLRNYNGSGKTIPANIALHVAPQNFSAKKVSLPPPGMPFSLTPQAVAGEAYLPPGESEHKIFYPMGSNCELWSEFNPKLYRMQAALSAGYFVSFDGKGCVFRPIPGSFSGNKFKSKISGTFGMREFKTDGYQFTINGQTTFLRGTVNCCEFPRTGYPDMTGKQWRKIFSTVKAYGLNHVRFHTWCPPEAAFETADEMGIYLEVELPDWCFHLGKDPAVTEFFQDEGERMIHEYGNHPSWVMLTMGNELKGDYSVLDDLENHFRAIDPQLLYDSTTYPSSKERGKMPEPADDYYISQDTKYGRARGQDIFENTVPNTETNYSHVISCIPVPYISHEVGQYCVYPNLAELPKYNGVLRSTALEAIQADLKAKHRLAEAPAYTRDSGKLAALLYKEEVERALRTTNQAGFQLLELNDFPGQGTSTVGLLDVFWDSKGIITPEQFRKFCGPVVPLLLMPKRVYQNDEVFDAGIEVANFGAAPITNATIAWKMFDGKKEMGSGSFQMPLIPLGHGRELGRIRMPLAAIAHAAKIKVTVGIPGTTIANDWNVWVYPKDEAEAQTNIEIFQTADADFFKALQEGNRVLLLPEDDDVASPLAGQFTTVFWNPIMFPNQPGSMGAMIDARHPVFADFPTSDWTDWQWWELLHDSFAMDLDALPVKVDMPLRFVDKFNRNALPAAIFEAKVGKGRLLVCTLDISDDLDSRIVARQLRRSILDYMAGNKFQPRDELSPAELRTLFP